MRKVLALCCLLGVLLLSACTPTGQTTQTTTTTTTTELETTISTDDSAWSDTDWSDGFEEPDDEEPVEDEDDDDYFDIFADLSDLYEEVRPVGNTAQKLDPEITGGSDAEAEALRQEILNTKDELEFTGTIYYVSPSGNDFENDGLSPETAWKSTEGVAMNQYLLEEGDAVLFERGGIYRRVSPLLTENGVTYAAYGEGEKPLFYGSISNYSWGMRWEPSFKENVWKITTDTAEAGIIVFNHGEATGTPKYYGVNQLLKNGDFYHNTADNTLYLYLDKGYPNVVYESIEIGTRENVFTVIDGAYDVTFDNLAIKYCGMFTWDVNEYTDNIRVTNCDVGWVGGCRFSNGDVGLGNGIQFWQTTSNALVEHCWFYQVYDAGISPQGIVGDGGADGMLDDKDLASVYTNIVYRNNLLEYCNYTFEVFDRNSWAIWDGLVIEDNICRFAGQGFLKAEDRPDRSSVVGHFVGWTHNYNYDEFPGGGMVIRNNIFDCSARNLICWYGKERMKNLTVTGNTYYQKANGKNEALHVFDNDQVYASNQAELEAAVALFDTDPKLVKWLS